MELLTRITKVYKRLKFTNKASHTYIVNSTYTYVHTITRAHIEQKKKLALEEGSEYEDDDEDEEGTSEVASIVGGVGVVDTVVPAPFVQEQTAITGTI